MADNKVENAEVAEEVCTKEKAVEQKKAAAAAVVVEDEDEVEEVEDEKESKDGGGEKEKAENGDAKEENGEEADDIDEDDKKEVTAEVTACKRKSNAGDAANGVEITPEKKQKLEDGEADEKETTEAAA